MTDTRLTHSDAYYVAQLLERLEGLEKQLSIKLSTDAELTQRTRHLLKDLRLLLAKHDTLAQELLEYTFMPKINRLLLDARQQLKLKGYLKMPK